MSKALDDANDDETTDDSSVPSITAASSVVTVINRVENNLNRMGNLNNYI